MLIDRSSALSVLAGLAALLATALPASAATPVGGAALLTQPVVWVARPSEAQISAVYPKGAKGIGYANVGCLLGPGGALKDCRVVGEAPQGFGFGAAALGLAPAFRVQHGPSSASDSIFLPIEFDPPGPKPAVDPINCLPPLCVLEIAPGHATPAQP